ncbi:MAG: DUF3089 domain-containing protein [Prevotellaceae bacterium]|nr:DUF3089 domain-containing protein [Prevotellaceae bacterium]
MKKIYFVLLFLACLACSSSHDDESTYIPVAPDYSNSNMWYQRSNDTSGEGADIFYIVSTWEFDWSTDEGIVSHYADPVGTKAHCDDMTIEISKIADYMSPGNNFYSPYYRHITLETWATCNEDIINDRYDSVSFVDVKKAFTYFMDSLNHDRAFILAGFSQGGKSVVELLKVMPEEVKERMIAAYVLGYKVTPEDTMVSKNIVAAKDSVDLGVTICYNSVSDVKYIQPVISAPMAMCINPVNWRTDATPATLHDTITVTLSPEHKVLVLDGYSGSEYKPILNFLNVGDFHSAEPWLYSECLAKNIQQRIKAYRNK